MPKLKISLREKAALSVEEVAAILGIGRDLVYRLVLDLDPVSGKPRLHSVRIGRRRVIPRQAVEIFMGQEG